MAKTGAPRIFFDVIGQFQAKRLINDASVNATITAAIFLDAFDSISQGFQDLFGQVMAGVDDVMESFLAFEEQLVRVRKFYGGMTDEADRFAQSSIDLGHTFGFAGEESLKAAAKMAQLKNILGSQEAVIAGTEMGLAFAAIGEMETDVAMNRLINLAQQTGFLYGNLTKETFNMLDAQQQADVVRGNSIRVLDQLNTVENSSVATMEQITFTLNQYAAQANLTGESIGEMAAMSALLIESGEESSRAGTGLRMMYQRLANEASGASDAIAGVTDGLEASEVRSMSLTEVMDSLSGSWATMEQEQKQQLAIVIGGGRHYVKFLKIMENHTRLVELQGEAYRATYPAIDELNVRLNSSFMTLNRFNAEIEDTKVRIGEELADAYVKAAKAHADFMLKVEKGLDNKQIKQTVENIIVMNEVFSETKPITDLLMAIGGLVIGFRTLSHVMAARRGEIDYVNNSYKLEAELMTRNIQIRQQAVRMTSIETSAINAVTQTRVNSAKGSYALAHRGIAQKRTEIAVTNQLINAHYAAGMARGVDIQTLAKQMNVNETRIRQLDREIVGQEKVIMGKKRVWDAEKRIQTQMLANSKGHEIMRTRSIALINEQNRAVQRLNLGLKAEAEQMLTEIRLSQPLTKATLTNLEAKSALAATNMQEARGRASNLTNMLAEAQARGHSTTKILEDIAAELALIEAQSGERMSIENLIRAHHNRVAAEQATVVSTEMMGIAAIKTAASQYTLAAAGKAVSKGFMFLSMASIFFTDTQKAMKVAGIAMATMMITTMLPSIITVDKATQKWAISTTAATGGINLLVGAAAALALWTFIPETVEEDLTTLYEIDESLNNINTTLNELSSRTDETLTNLLPGYEDTTIADFVADPELAKNAEESINDIIGSLNEGLLTAEGDEKISLNNQLTMWTEHYGTIQDITLSHNAQQLAIQKQGWSDKQILESAKAKEIDDLIAEHDARARMGYFAEEGSVAESFGMGTREQLRATYQYRINALLDINDDANKSLIENTRVTNELSIGYWDEMLGAFEASEEARVDAVVSANDDIIQEMEGFANNREELFWGSRENFTGALYKQIQQGQIENLLYKTELMQTNNFYGVTLDEAIERVQNGVLEMLRDENVI